MAVAPIQNPINAAPLDGASQETIDQRAAAQKEMLDPGLVGDDLNKQFQDHAALSNQAATTAAQAHQAATNNQQTIEGMQNQINTLTAALQSATQQPAQPAAPSIEQTHAYNQDELTELGQRLPGTIDKRAELAAAKMRDEAVAAANNATSEQVAALQKEIDTLKAQTTNLEANEGNAFRAQTMALAGSNGLSVTQLAEDPEWKAMLAESSDPMTGKTYHQWLEEAIATKNPQTMGTLFEIFGKRQQAKQAAQHPASPHPQGGGARVNDANGEGLNSLQGEIDAIYAQQKELRSQRLSSQISVEHFQTQMQTLQTNMREVQSKLEQFYQ